ncbi:heme ABC exporter ATP-binding protein CcmA [Psychrobacter sp. HD31]|uniref:heme ABC exporter ATP-binding protein CcmA n=1 Tax=Psychrobacter sp. HD31 TaxID=3112003 RepID=UPI003DA58EEE
MIQTECPIIDKIFNAVVEGYTIINMTTHQTPILQLTNVNIQRGDLILCQDVSVTLKAGEICHLKGANGAGKTTLLMQLAGILPIFLDNTNLDDTNRLSYRPLYVSHQLGIHPDLTVQQNLVFLLNLYGLYPSPPQIANALNTVGLNGYQAISCRQLSAGQTRRVNLARLWLMQKNDSPLWLLDEPFTALDASMVTKLQDKIRAFADNGGAVLMTSHQLDGMHNLADTVLDLSYYLANG